MDGIGVLFILLPAAIGFAGLVLVIGAFERGRRVAAGRLVIGGLLAAVGVFGLLFVLGMASLAGVANH